VSRSNVVGLIVIVVASLAIGLVAGHGFYRLYVDSIPDALKASTSLAGTRVVFLWRGFLLGGVVAAFAIVAVLASRWFAPRSPARAGDTERR